MPSIMIVDDSDYSRALLRQQLAKLGHEVLEAEDGKQAWEIIQRETVNIVITDWVMPNMDGLELCRLIRSANLPRYIYIILLTIKDEKSDMVTGIEAGADNFLVKPCSLAQLRVMLFTGKRVLNYERTLLDRNRRLARAHKELKLGLRAAGNFHKTLLPADHQRIGATSFFCRSKPCDYATGDMYNFFRLDDHTIVFYLLDVAGHGVPAAMLSFTLSHFLSAIPMGDLDATDTMLNFFSPADITSSLNRRFQGRSDDWLSFTMIYGLIHEDQQKVTFTQAGHPPLIYQPKGQPSQALGDGGFPVGFFADVTYDEYEFSYKPGDRVFIYSDGITECQNPKKQPYTIDRLRKQFDQASILSLDRTLNLVLDEVKKWSGSDKFDDDISLLAIEFGE